VTAPAPRRSRRRLLVVGYDGSPSARAAASWAAADVGARGKLVLVLAERPLHAPALPDPAARERLGRAVLDELLLDGDARLLDAQLTTELSEDDPVTALIDAAERHRAGAIVVGSKRHSRVRRALGVVTGELFERSPVPVIVVPASVSPKPDATARRRRAQSPAARSGSRAGQGSRGARRA
jgi:nucleotide-binding universal stress UspA family protein